MGLHLLLGRNTNQPSIVFAQYGELKAAVLSSADLALRWLGEIHIHFATVENNPNHSTGHLSQTVPLS